MSIMVIAVGRATSRWVERLTDREQDGGHGRVRLPRSSGISGEGGPPNRGIDLGLNGPGRPGFGP